MDGLGAGLDVGAVEADGLGAGLDDVGLLEPDGLAALDEAGLDDDVLEPVGALAASSGPPTLDPLELGPGTPAPIVTGPGSGARAQTWHGCDPDASVGADGRVADLSE